MKYFLIPGMLLSLSVFASDVHETVITCKSTDNANIKIVVESWSRSSSDQGVGVYALVPYNGEVRTIFAEKEMQVPTAAQSFAVRQGASFFDEDTRKFDFTYDARTRKAKFSLVQYTGYGIGHLEFKTNSTLACKAK